MSVLLLTSCIESKKEQQDEKVNFITENEIAEYLVDFARSMDTIRDGKIKALSMAKQIAPDSEAVFKAVFELQRTNGLKENRTISKKQLVTSGLKIVSRLSESGHKIVDGPLVKARVISLLSELDSNNAEVAFESHLLEKKGMDPAWNKLPDLESLVASENPVETPRSGFSRDHSSVKGLHFRPYGNEQRIGDASLITASLLPSTEGEQLDIIFKQKVSRTMEAALLDVKKFILNRHRDLTLSGRVEITFENHISQTNGRSASLACALLLDSLITGEQISDGILLTGNLNSEGLVQPVEGVFAMIRTAVKDGRKVIAVPDKNAKALLDLVIAEGPSSISGIQVFSISNFQEALEITRSEQERNSNLAEAVDQFSEIQTVLNKPNGLNFLTNQHVIRRLEKVVELAPNHATAEALLVAANGQAPKMLSLGGSLAAIEFATNGIMEEVQDGRFDPRSASTEDSTYADAILNIRRIRPKLDARTLDCADSVVELSDAMRIYINSRPRSYSKLHDLTERIKGAAASVKSEHDQIRTEVNAQLSR
ncbi:MAG: hypothetical protein MI807_16655 [Verrucomicrobiales bacterium]|nr:hypothetical protein [Verrucomicrobiales bacterium]